MPNRRINDIISDLYMICSDQELAALINNHLPMNGSVTASGIRKRRLRMGLKKGEKEKHTADQYAESILILQAAIYEAFLNLKINWFFGEEHFARFLSSPDGKKLLTDVTIRLAKEVLYARIKNSEGCESSTKNNQGERHLCDAAFG